MAGRGLGWAGWDGQDGDIFLVLTDVFCLSVRECVYGWICTRNSCWCAYNRAERACSVLVLVLSLVWCFSDCLVLSYDVLVIPGTSWSDGSRPLLPFSVVLDCGGLVSGRGGRCRGVVVGRWCGVVWCGCMCISGLVADTLAV
jgi:hypothetical protein